MGASGWDYRVPFNDSAQESFLAVQQELLATGDYIWPWDDIDADDAAYESVSRPTTLAELAEAKEAEEFWEVGTHTLLDLERVVNAAETDEFGVVRPLSSAELLQVFGTDQPTVEDFHRAYEPGPSGPLADLMGPKWSGRSLVIFPRRTGGGVLLGLVGGLIASGHSRSSPSAAAPCALETSLTGSSVRVNHGPLCGETA